MRKFLSPSSCQCCVLDFIRFPIVSFVHLGFSVGWAFWRMLRFSIVLVVVIPKNNVFIFKLIKEVIFSRAAAKDSIVWRKSELKSKIVRSFDGGEYYGNHTKSSMTASLFQDLHWILCARHFVLMHLQFFVPHWSSTLSECTQRNCCLFSTKETYFRNEHQPRI